MWLDVKVSRHKRVEVKGYGFWEERLNVSIFTTVQEVYDTKVGRTGVSSQNV